MSSPTNLPFEILERVVQFLSGDNIALAHIALVNKSFANVARRLLYRHLRVSNRILDRWTNLGEISSLKFVSSLQLSPSPLRLDVDGRGSEILALLNAVEQASVLQTFRCEDPTAFSDAVQSAIHRLVDLPSVTAVHLILTQFEDEDRSRSLGLINNKLSSLVLLQRPLLALRSPLVNLLRLCLSWPVLIPVHDHNVLANVGYPVLQTLVIHRDHPFHPIGRVSISKWVKAHAALRSFFASVAPTVRHLSLEVPHVNENDHRSPDTDPFTLLADFQNLETVLLRTAITNLDVSLDWMVSIVRRLTPHPGLHKIVLILDLNSDLDAIFYDLPLDTFLSHTMVNEIHNILLERRLEKLHIHIYQSRWANHAPQYLHERLVNHFPKLLQPGVCEVTFAKDVLDVPHGSTADNFFLHGPPSSSTEPL